MEAPTLPAESGIFEVYDVEANAQAAFDDISGGCDIRSRSETPEGRIGGELSIERGNVYTISSLWRDLCEEIEVDAVSHASDPMVGKKFTSNVMITVASVPTVVFAEVEIGIGLNIGQDYSLIGEHVGESFNIQMRKECVVEMLQHAVAAAAAVAGAAPSPIVLPTAMVGENLWRAIKALPSSKSIADASAVCAGELLVLARGHSPNMVAGLSVSSGMAYNPMDLSPLTVAVATLGKAVNGSMGSMASVPSESAAALGRALTSLLGGAVSSISLPPPPPSGASTLVSVLKSKAIDGAAFDMFLQNAYMLFMPVAKHAWAATLGPPAIEVHLEKFLQKGGAVTSAEALKRLPAKLDAGQLGSAFDDLVDAVKAKEAPFAPPPPPPPTHPVRQSAPGRIIVNMADEDKQSEDDARLYEQLQEDAFEISVDKQAMGVIDALRKLRESGSDDKTLANFVKSVQDARIQRLLHSPARLQTVLRGEQPDIARTLTGVRDVIERRLEHLVTKKNLDVSPDTLVRAFRAVRTGNFVRLKIFHLLDDEVPDGGTTECPLKQIASWSTETAAAKVTSAFHRVAMVVGLVWPEVQSEAMHFFPAFGEKINYYVGLGVEAKALNKWYRQIMHMISKPSRRFATGAANVDFVPFMDERWFKDASEFHDAIHFAVQHAISDKAMQTLRAEFSSGKRASEGVEPKLTKKQKAAAKAAAATKPELEKKSGKGDTPVKKGDKPEWRKDLAYCAKGEEPTKDGDGKYLQMLGAGHADLLAFNQANPKKDNKFVCWAEANFAKGCVNPKCSAWHKKKK